MQTIPPLLLSLLALYLVMSILTFLAYALDQHRAKHHQWRIKESTLHLLELLAGWPGALLAQFLLHHKNHKPTYMIVFVVIIAIHVSLWLACIHFGWPA